MLMGEYYHSIDEKNRLIIPSKIRSELGNTYIITRGIDKCLFIYSLNEWQKVVDKLSTLPFTKKDARNFSRFLLSGASKGEFDKQGRIVLTSQLMSYANLTKDVVIIGVNERLEVWNKSDYEEFINNNIDSFSLIAENLFEGGQDA